MSVNINDNVVHSVFDKLHRALYVAGFKIIGTPRYNRLESGNPRKPRVPIVMDLGLWEVVVFFDKSVI